MAIIDINGAEIVSADTIRDRAVEIKARAVGSKFKPEAGVFETDDKKSLEWEMRDAFCTGKNMCFQVNESGRRCPIAEAHKVTTVGLNGKVMAGVKPCVDLIRQAKAHGSTVKLEAAMEKIKEAAGE